MAVFLVGTGTAANTLGIANYARPGGVVLLPPPRAYQCRRGRRLGILRRDQARRNRGPRRQVHGGGAWRGRSTRYPDGNVHYGQPVVASVSEITELGAAYGARRGGGDRHGGEAAWHGRAHGWGALRRRRGEPRRDAGRRRPGGRASTCFPSAGTKNGCLAAEAVVFFNPADARDFGFARQRAGHGFSKAWFIAAQFDAWLDARALARPRTARQRDGARGSRRRSAPVRTARLALAARRQRDFRDLPKALDARLKAAGRNVPSVVGGDAAGRGAAGTGRGARPADHVVPDQGPRTSTASVRFSPRAEAKKKKGAPERRPRPIETGSRELRGDPGLDLLLDLPRRAAVDGDGAGLHRLGDLRATRST